MRLLSAASVLVLAAWSSRGGQPSPAAAEVAGLLPGTYRSRDADASFRFAVAAVPKSRFADGAAVFYAEVSRTAQPGTPLLQRFLRLEDDGTRISIRVYEPRDLAGVRGKWREPESLALFTARDVRERPDCLITLARAPAGHWTGGTRGATCFSAVVNAPLAVSMSLSPQTFEWREEGKDAAGKTVYGPSGEIAVYAREREGAAPAPGAGAAPPPALAALSAPVAGGAGPDGGFPSKVNAAAAAQAPTMLSITGPSSPSKKHDLAELRAMAGTGTILLGRLMPVPDAPAASVVVVTSRNGAVSVFSFAEISSPGGPSLDLSSGAPRLVAAPGRSLDDVVSVELRALTRGE